MTLADRPESQFSPSGNQPIPKLSDAPKRSWLDVLLHRPEPDPPPAPLPPRARPLKKNAEIGAPSTHVDGPGNGIGKTDVAAARRNGGMIPDVPAHSPPKPLPYVADLIVMSTLDQKEPPAAPGAGDLLDSLVQDHLQRTAGPREKSEAAAIALGADLLATPAAPTPVETPTPGSGKEGRLQKEIASLLSDPSAEAPVEPHAADAPLTVDPFADFPVAAPPIEQVPPKPGQQNVSSQNVSSAELEVLLEDMIRDPASAGDSPVEQGEPAETSAAEAVLAELAADAAGPTQIEQPAAVLPHHGDDEVASKLSEADGVMAQELAQLMNDKPAAPAAPGSPVPAELEAAVQSIMKNPVQMADKSAAAPAAATEDSPTAVTPPNAVAIETAPAAAAVAVAEASAANVASTLDTLADATVRPAAAPPNLIVRAWRFVMGIFIMILQVLDMPFGWIKEPDKNVLGMAALLLLLGGAVLKVLSWWMERH